MHSDRGVLGSLLCLTFEESEEYEEADDEHGAGAFNLDRQIGCNINDHFI